MTDLNSLVASQSLHAQTGGTFIGSLVWWSLNGNHVTHARLKELATQHGLPERFLPKEVKPTSAFRRAWRHASTKLPAGLLLRQIDETETGIHVGLVEEQADSQAHQLAYDHLVTIAYSKDHQTIQASGQHHIVDQIRSLYAHHQELTTRDLRSMLSSFVSEAGVSLRESGGVYFIPSAHKGTVEAMAATLQSISHNDLHRLPLYDSPLAQDVLNGVAVATLDDEVRKLSEELEAYMGEEKTRKSTLKKRLDVFDSLRSRVNTFAGVLSFKADDLLDKVALMEDELRQHLSLMDQGAPKAKKLPPVSAAPTNSPDETPPSQDVPPAQDMPAPIVFDLPPLYMDLDLPSIFDEEAGF